jgi:hypothetical protein
VGIDFLDVSFELEKQFGVRLEPEDLLPVWTARGNDCTVADLHDVVVQKCRLMNLRVPRSSWNRIRIALVKSLGVPVREMKRDAWLRKDLEFD